MSLISLFLVFLMVWLIMFFMSLPFGIKISEPKVLGNAKSAPDKPNLKLKFLISFFLSFFPTMFIYWIINKNILFNLIMNSK